MTAKERAIGILNELPLSKAQRELYLRGLNKMTEEEIKSATNKLEDALNRAPAALEAARELLKERLRYKK